MNNTTFIEASGLPSLNREPEPTIFPAVTYDGDSQSRQANPDSSESKSRPLHSLRAPTCFEGASHFGIKQANLNHHNLQVVTINNYHSRLSPIDGKRQCLCSRESHDGVCTCIATSSHVVANLSTPTQHLRFEFSQEEVEANDQQQRGLPHDQQISTDRESTDVASLLKAVALRREAELGVREQLSDEYLKRFSEILPSAVRSARKEQDGQSLSAPEPRSSMAPSQTHSMAGVSRHDFAVGEPLITVFGTEGCKGIHHALRGFSLLQQTAGKGAGRLVQLHARFLPHYNALTKDAIMGLGVPVKVTIARVVDTLHSARRALGLGQALTFDIILSHLTQLLFLQSTLGDSTTSFRTVKCSQGSRVSNFLIKSQWIIDIVESDEPESILDSVISPPDKENSKGKGELELPSRWQRDNSDANSITLIDLTVLSFPHVGVPRFKLSHLRLKCFTSKQGGFSRKVEVGAIVEYTSRYYHIREAVIPRMSPDTRNQAIVYAENLFAF